jgi:hypothetical protein
VTEEVILMVVVSFVEILVVALDWAILVMKWLRIRASKFAVGFS